jgi:hypothetical protein
MISLAKTNPKNCIYFKKSNNSNNLSNLSYVKTNFNASNINTNLNVNNLQQKYR